MSRLIDLTGQRFGRLYVLGEMKIILVILIEEKHSGGVNAVARNIQKFLFVVQLLDLVILHLADATKEKIIID